MEEALKIFTKIVRKLDPQDRENLSADVASVTAALGASKADVSSLAGIQNDALLAEVTRRGLLVDLHGAVGALYDNLSDGGILDGDSNTTAYLAYRLRRVDAKLSGAQGEIRTADYWQQRIDAMGRKSERPRGQ